jgi:hypothetical protein
VAEYRIEFSIQRCTDDSGEFTEIGFGSSATWETLDACTYAVESIVGNGEWETSAGMPEPEEVLRDLRAAQDA